MHALVPKGPFSLRAAAEFGFGPTAGRASFDGAMRLAFAVDGGAGYAGVVLRQSETRSEPAGAQAAPDQSDSTPTPHVAELYGTVHVEVQVAGGAGEAAVTEAAVAQTARIVSLDHDGAEFLRVGERDPVIGELQRAHPGQRPVLFHSPYEAAAWAIISSRRPAPQAALVRDAIAQTHGERFELAGQTLHAFPQPDRLARLPDDTPGLNAQKVERLRGVAAAALRGDLDVPRLHELGAEAAYEDVQKLKGIGPFYAGLVVLRASGFADALLAMNEPRVLTRTAELYGLDAPSSLEEFAALADRWRPFRTWTMVLIRLGGDRAARRGAGA